MLQAARAVQQFVHGRTPTEFETDLYFRSAVERQVEIIGEAANAVTPEFRAKHPEIPWEKIVITRHRFVHEYFGLDPVIVWRIATVHVPQLIPPLEAIGLQPPSA